MLPFALSLIALIMACLIPGGTILMVAVGIGWSLWGLLGKKPLRIGIGLVVAAAGVVIVPLIQDQFTVSPQTQASIAMPLPVAPAGLAPGPLVISPATVSTTPPPAPIPYAATPAPGLIGSSSSFPGVPTAPNAGLGGDGSGGALDLSRAGVGGAPPVQRPQEPRTGTR